MAPHDILVHHWPTGREVRVQKERLTEEGQIEPIVLLPDNSPDLDEYAYAEAQVVAAQELGWSSLLVTYER